MTRSSSAKTASSSCARVPAARREEKASSSGGALPPAASAPVVGWRSRSGTSPVRSQKDCSAAVPSAGPDVAPEAAERRPYAAETAPASRPPSEGRAARSPEEERPSPEDTPAAAEPGSPLSSPAVTYSSTDRPNLRRCAASRSATRLSSSAAALARALLNPPSSPSSSEATSEGLEMPPAVDSAINSQLLPKGPELCCKEPPPLPSPWLSQPLAAASRTAARLEMRKTAGPVKDEAGTASGGGARGRGAGMRAGYALAAPGTAAAGDSSS